MLCQPHRRVFAFVVLGSSSPSLLGLPLLGTEGENKSQITFMECYYLLLGPVYRRKSDVYTEMVFSARESQGWNGANQNQPWHFWAQPPFPCKQGKQLQLILYVHA